MSENEELPGQLKRKLTTILAADVVGYSRMMGADEDHTYELLGKCRKIIDRNIAHHGGRIFNTAGDSVMAEFGSTVEAVRCAIEIQEEIDAHNTGKPESEQMWFRIGLNVGDVIIEGDDLIGDGVNIASRMESIAPPSGICISGSVYELVRNKLSYAFDDMGRQSVKNIIEPVSAYSLRPVSTPHLMPAADADEKEPGKKKNWKKRVLIAAAIVFVLAVIANQAEKKKKTTVGDLPGKPVGQAAPEAKPQSQTAGLPDLETLVASRLVGKEFEGKTPNGDRFVIKLAEDGNASIRTYRKNKPNKVHKSDSGQWRITSDDQICLQFKKFNNGKETCRDITPPEGR